MSNNNQLLPGQSPIWKGLKEYRGKVKRNNEGDLFYQWDYTHGDIEVYNKRGKHLGCIDGIEGKRIKSAVDGRTIDI